MRNSEFEIIKSPWLDKFISLIADTREKFIFTSPFVKLSAVKLVLENRKYSFSIDGAVSYRLRNFERGASDLDAIGLLHEANASVVNIPNLHSKIYIFDSSSAIISSANLTAGGLLRNVEIGILLKQINAIKELKSYILNMLSDSEKSFNITEEIISESFNILESLPKTPKEDKSDFSKMEKVLFMAEDAGTDVVFQGGSKAILNGLTGWKRDIFECLLNIDKDVFNLDEIYTFENNLSALHPENRNIKPKIRQQLQILRDIGLLEFGQPGVYKKLWK